MKTIQTTYRGPTNHRPATIHVTDGDHRRWFSYQEMYSESGCGRDEQAHMEAVRRFCQEFGWSGEITHCQMPMRTAKSLLFVWWDDCVANRSVIEP